jgi:hypothetical protein
MFRDGGKGQFEWRNTIAPLLGDWVVLLAMKHRRAPLPVSSALWKGLLRKGFPNDLDELGVFARRYLFLGDARMLLAELKDRTGTASHVRAALPKYSEVGPERNYKSGKHMNVNGIKQAQQHLSQAAGKL